MQIHVLLATVKQVDVRVDAGILCSRNQEEHIIGVCPLVLLFHSVPRWNLQTTHENLTSLEGDVRAPVNFLYPRVSKNSVISVCLACYIPPGAPFGAEDLLYQYNVLEGPLHSFLYSALYAQDAHNRPTRNYKTDGLDHYVTVHFLLIHSSLDIEYFYLERH